VAEELELKFRIDPRHASRLWDVLEERLGDSRSATHTLFSAYYDTPDGLLKRNGAALRLRRHDGRWIQTVKRGGTTLAGLHRREEHEIEVAAQLPSFPALVEAGLGDLLSDPQARDALGVAFTTEFTRTATTLEIDGSRIEVALDQGVIAAEARRLALCEIELELLAGTAAPLFGLGREIARALPVRLDGRSKAERGHALASGARAQPVKGVPGKVDEDMTVAGGLAALAAACLCHLQANEDGVLAGRNPEYLHQARVAVRRLRSLLRLFGPVLPPALLQSQEALRALGLALGEARNFDVFLDEVLPGAGASDHPGMASLRQRALAARGKAMATARAALRAPGYTLMMLDLAQALHGLEGTQEPVPAAGLGAFAQEALARELARVRKRGRGLRDASFEELHRLRIAVKRLRYATEFFEALAPKRAQSALENLAALQGLLGRINDDVTAWKLLDALAVESADTAFQQAIGYVRGWTAADAWACRGKLRKAWKQLKRETA
jgi:inorganic triphosphatase YgiF